MPPQHIQQGINQIMQASLGIEVIYSFVIILCALLIYFGTKELYNLSSHKGIKYFRLAFLFFAISYFFRSLIKFVMLVFAPRQIMNFSPMLFGPISLFFFMYFSSMAVFYLLYSVLWKNFEENKNKIYLFHALATAISILSLLFNGLLSYLILNLFLLIFITIVFFISHRDVKKKKKSNLYAIYVLLFIFWILNLLDILIPNIFQTFQIIIYLASITIFLLILYKVLRKVGN
jgi:hypothetical protein